MNIATLIRSRSKTARIRHAELFERACAYPGRPRERVLAMLEAEQLFARLYPHPYRLMRLVRVASWWGKSASPYRQAMWQCERHVMSLLTGVVVDAVDCGDLQMTTFDRPGDLSFTLWAMVFGARSLTDASPMTHQLHAQDAMRITHHAAERFLDVIPWRPLSTQWDYGKTRARVREAFFADECREA